MQEQNKLFLPIAIIIAGALIAGGIYLSRGGNKTVTTNVAPVASSTIPDITVAPVTDTDHVLGNPSSPIVFVEYSDTECPYCQVFQTTMHKVIDNYGKTGQVAWVYRHFPIHSKSSYEAQAIECVNELGGGNAFWKYLDTIFTKTKADNNLDPKLLTTWAGNAGVNKTQFQSCLDSGKYATAIKNAYESAVKAGGTGTPHNILVLSKPASSNLKTLLKTLESQIESQAPLYPNQPPYIYVPGNSNNIVVMSGAMPYEMITQILDTALTN